MPVICKKIIVGVLSALILCVGCSSCAVSADTSPVLYANAFGGDKGSCDTVTSWIKNEEELFLFLPSDTDFASLKLWCKPSAKISINGESVKGGNVCSQLTADGIYSLACGKNIYQLTVISSRNTPTVFIETDTGSLDAIHADKSHKESGRMTVYENGEQTVSAALDYIKGRGNHTWDGEKRPYNIKFTEEVSLLGMGAAEKWCLLANVFDETLIRNSVALTLAQRIEIPYACDFRAADVYINGDYRGSYLIT